MFEPLFGWTNLDLAGLATSVSVAISSTVIIVAFSLLAYTLTYNFGNSAARRFAILLACVVVSYTADVALNRVESAGAAVLWLRIQWLGIAMLPFAYFVFSTAVLRTTNYPIRWERWAGRVMLLLSTAAAGFALFGNQLVGGLVFHPPLSYLEAGPYFWLFAGYFAFGVTLALRNIWKARQRCLTESSRKRMSYLFLGFIAPGVGIFPYLIALSRISVGTQSNALVFSLAMIGNVLVIGFLLLMHYSVAYFGVLTPDRVVRYRLVRFFARGPIVAILVIVAIQTLPRVESVLGLPRDLILFSTITFVIIFSQLILSITKSWVDRAVYREDRREVAWLRELDRRLLTTSDLHQFLENNLTALCELLRTRSGFVAAVIGPDLVLEALLGSNEIEKEVTEQNEWPEVINRILSQIRNHAESNGGSLQPIYHADFWIWPLLEQTDETRAPKIVGILGVRALAEEIEFTDAEQTVLEQLLQRTAQALLDRQLQKEVFVTLERIIPGIEQIHRARGMIPYSSDTNGQYTAEQMLAPSPIHDPQFDAWVKDALSHYWGGPKLTRSPLQGLRLVNQAIDKADGDPTRALRLVLESAVERMRPEGKQDLNTPEWLLYNILDMRFMQGRKVREIANRLAMSESDLYRKQRVAIGQVARVLTEMEQDNPNGNGSGAPDSSIAEASVQVNGHR